MNNYRYSKIIFLLAIVLSLVNLIDNFFENSLLFVPYSLAWVIFTAIGLTEDSYLRRYLNIFIINNTLKFFIFFNLGLVFFYSAISRLIEIFYLIPVDMQYFLLLPLIIILILITGATYGVTYKIYECIYK